MLCLAGSALGALVGYLDLHATEVQGPALMIVVSAGALGMLQPRYAWLAALLVGLGVPVAHGLNALLGMKQPYVITPWYSGIVLPLLFALGAAYAGVGLRNILRASTV
jgi:hypothetical protein